MPARSPIGAMAFVATVIALLAGLSWWSLPSRRTAAHALVEAPALDTAQPMHLHPTPDMRPARVSNPQLGAAATRQRLLGRGHAISASIAAGRQALKSRYDGEPVDAAWAARKERALASANDAPQIREVGAKPLAFSSQCRSRTCLISADFASTVAVADWVSLYTLVAGPEVARAAMQRSDNPDGTIHLQVYASARR